MPVPEAAASAGPPVWDPVVKLTHWVVAVVVLGNALMTEGGSPLHVAAGWLGMAMVVVRLIWGLVGPASARLSAFPPNPRAALSHLADLAGGRPRDYPSHNPAGALMVWALWAALAVVIGTGLYMTGGATPMQTAENAAVVETGDWTELAVTPGDEAGEDEDEGAGEWAEEVHEVAANLMLVLAVLHVAGVLGESLIQRRNLVTAMLPGRRR